VTSETTGRCFCDFD